MRVVAATRSVRRDRPDGSSTGADDVHGASAARSAAPGVGTPASRSPSLKRALTGRLVVGLLAIGLVGGVAAYTVGTRYANRAYDRALFDGVQVLASQVRWADDGVRIALSHDALQWLMADEGETIRYRVTDLASGREVIGNGDLGPVAAALLETDEPYFRSTAVDGLRFRVAYVRRRVGPDEGALVEIGETLGKRDRIARGILVGTVSMVGLLGLAAIALVRSGINRALVPLQRLEADVARASIARMQALDPGSAPAEVRALIDAINRMIGRVAEAIDGQRHFLANAAHQLKTPIAGLRLQAQLALKTELSRSARDNLLEVERRAAHSAHLIEQLLTLARAEAGDDVLPAADCALEDIALEVIERRLADAIARRIDLGFDGDGRRGVIVANPVLAGELIANLVDNSLRYGREGGQVTVTLATDDDAVVLGVSDDGAGLSTEQREQVFRRFWRSDAAGGHGAGLGLAIVKEIAERYRGTVAIVSRPDFDGTRVEVRFPTGIHGAASGDATPAATVGTTRAESGDAARTAPADAAFARWPQRDRRDPVARTSAASIDRVAGRSS